MQICAVDCYVLRINAKNPKAIGLGRVRDYAV